MALKIILFLTLWNTFSIDTTLAGKRSAREATSKLSVKSKLKLRYSKKLYKFWIKYFTKRDKLRFIRHMKNAVQYRDVVTKILRKHGLPEDLFYVALIESGFNAKIKSRAGAVGPWQFVRGTAVRYGLRVDKNVDERRNIYKATDAAARYFNDLYNIFGSWELALCAYNKGEFGIIRAIRKGKTRDYRDLIRLRLIPKETRYYIPKVIAARELFRNPRKYKLPAFKNSGAFFANAKKVSIRETVNVSDVLKATRVSYKDFFKLNPDIKRSTLKGWKRRPLSFYLPRESYHKISRVTGTQKKVRKGTKYYRVKRGDSLYRVARRFNVSAKRLANFNHLKVSHLKVGQKLKIPSRSQRSERRIRHYFVKPGDSLIEIARRFRTSVQSIRERNSLKSSVIYPKQRLVIPSSS